MNNINKIITFLIFTFIFSLFNLNEVLANVDDVAPFSNEIIKEDVVLDLSINSSEKIIDIEKENIIPLVTNLKQNGKLDGAQIIKGEVKSGYNIKVYIDGIYRTTLEVWPSKTGISGFFYQPIQKLSLGKHNVNFVSTKNGIDYGSSNKVQFEVVEGYKTPEILTPYYYADNPSTYVIRGYGSLGDRIEVYVDDIKVRFINSLQGNTSDVYFALAVKNIKEGTHKAFILSYDKNDNKVSKSKLIYFDVKYPTTNEKIILNSSSTEVKNEKIENNKEVINQTDKNTGENKNNNSKDADKNSGVIKEKKDNSITIGIILFIVAILLIIFWLISENRDKVKKFIDNLFEEDNENDLDNK